MIEGLGFVWLEVADLERSLTFYCDGLRFALDRRDDDDGSPHAHLSAGDLHLVLAQSAAAPSRNQRGNGVRLSIEVSGVDAYHDALVARGVGPSPPADDAATRFFEVRDPDGYVWFFHQSLA